MRITSLTLALTLLAAAPSTTTAASRTGQQTVGPTTLEATYDGESTVTITATNQAVGLANPFSAAPPSKVDAALRMDCTPGAVDPDPAEITISAGDAELDPYEDSTVVLKDNPMPEASTLKATFYGEDELNYKDWRCLSGTVDKTPFSFYFDGYGPFTVAIAERAVRQDLNRLYSSDVMKRLAYLECPQIEFGVFIDEEFGGLCEYQIGRGANTRAGAYIATAPQHSEPRAKRVASNKYSQRLVECPAKFERSEAFGARSRVINKRLRTPRIMCGSLFIRLDLPGSAHRARSLGKRRFSAGEHGTNRAGFEELVSYPCRFTSRKALNQVHYKVRCANQLGNRIRYDFTISTPPPKPKRPTPRQTGSGNNYAGKTCDEIGHPYNVTPGTDREHDADGDGIACESQ